MIFALNYYAGAAYTTEKDGSMAREKKADKAVRIPASLVCRDCGALAAVEKKPPTVHCPTCGMSSTITKRFKG